ncbi:pre-mRNA-splicing factor CWC25 [Pochonia chlamydosporia 170]|uniref:Pre-mRNA-splicing factor CWC25 n=1 Tax=Pochonia chlamydosporia 170 TaxID=1380566 RepID=A0A179F372_METCM|nr:pre-mRNA-splicing factor CWC25 [Pochonia chlamydosporia 170]OAQ59857.2 pre-mRNA-splicing factor CWC25 [Pochonia chlamydosporia 170]
MGGGDLNLKKSFHPTLRRNQQAVYEEEQKALAERKRTQQRVNEIKEERAKEELQRQLEAAGGKKRVDRVDWMYQGPTDGQVGTSEETEAYLLGKRRIDNLIKGTDHKKLEKSAGEDSFMALQNANSARDTASKIRDDPLLAIKRQEQAAYEAMMNDPIKRRQLMANMGIEDEKKKGRSRDKEHRHRHKHRRHRSRSRDSEVQDVIARMTTRRNADTDTEGGENPGTVEARAEPETIRWRDDMREATEGTLIIKKIMAGEDMRAQAPVMNDHVDAVLLQTDATDTAVTILTAGKMTIDVGTTAETTTVGGDHGMEIGLDIMEMAEKARKLATMQSAASDMDQDREKRLASLEREERAAREADERARERGGERGFVNGLHKQAGKLDLGERMGRNRQGYQRDDD